jgi:hypothetical protein
MAVGWCWTTSHRSACPAGRRRRRPTKVHADKAYDHRRCQASLRRRGPPPLDHRVHQAWLGGFRRLRIRAERSWERCYALTMLACSVISFNALQQLPW